MQQQVPQASPQDPQILQNQQITPGNHFLVGGQQVIVINNVEEKDVQLQQYMTFRAKVCGYIQISMGCLAIIFNMAAAIIDYNSLWAISTGWWGSPFIIIAGCLGVASARYKTRALINSAMAFSIISSILIVPMLVQCGLSISNGYQCCGNWDRSAYVAMNAFLIIIILVEAATAIYQSLLCCLATCACCREIAMIDGAMTQQQISARPGQQQQQQFVYYNPSMAANQQQPQMQVQSFSPQQQQHIMTQQQFIQQQMPQEQQFTQQHLMTYGPPPADDASLPPGLPPAYENINKE